jgi:hypothetical protein
LKRGKETGPVKFRFFGDEKAAQQYTGAGRAFLGKMKEFMRLSNIKSYQADAQLKDNDAEVGAIRAKSNTNGLADIDEVWIIVPKLPKRKDMLEILILGYILSSDVSSVKVIYPSKIEVGNEVYNQEGVKVNFDNWNDWEYSGFNDFGLHQSTIVNSPDYQQLFAFHYEEHGEWRRYDVETYIGPDWATLYPNWPPLMIDPYPPVSIDYYFDDANCFRRTDGGGFWTYYGYDDTQDGKFLIQMYRTIAPIETSRYDGFSLFNIPMQGSDLKFRLPSDVQTDASWNLSVENDWTIPGVIAISPIDHLAYEIMDSRDGYSNAGTPSSEVGVTIKAPEQGEHIIKSDPGGGGSGLRQDGSYGIEFKIVLFTDKGKFTKKLAFTQYGMDSQPSENWVKRFSITVGKVEKIEDAIRIIDGDHKTEPTL